MIDFCYPNNNEQAFLDMAEKLGLKGLCFIYRDKKSIKKIDHKSLKTFTALQGSPGAADLHVLTELPKRKPKEKIVMLSMPIKKNKSFHYPFRNPNQVFFKELKEKEMPFVMSFQDVANANKLPKTFEEMSFLLKLCQKYNVPVIFSTLATDPYLLRSETDLRSVVSLLSKNTTQQKQAVTFLAGYLSV